MKLCSECQTEAICTDGKFCFEEHCSERKALCPSGATPCSQSCPKCGSNDISRKTRLKGEIWHEYNERQRSNYLIFVGKIRSKARQDCVQAWCRECAYAWEVSAMDSDRRCPYWQLANEAMSTLEAMEFDGELSPPEMDFLSRLKAAFPIPLNDQAQPPKVD